ncbi:pyridoxamine 5'-phosphate oxidase family protein [Thermoactinospora rubra]|uniref:pyridoxamine 5'-phosphate oxidase family protein n=1 Tax=Thermoactinospora rubra TaxID=1088767 RepID=UPI000A0FA3C3
MHVDGSGLRVLSRRECLELLASAPIGRIVFTDRALPAVQPVNFRLDGERVVIRTTTGSKLAALPLEPWAPGERDHFIVVEVEQVSGRRITRARSAWSCPEAELGAQGRCPAGRCGWRPSVVVLSVRHPSHRSRALARSAGVSRGRDLLPRGEDTRRPSPRAVMRR